MVKPCPAGCTCSDCADVVLLNADYPCACWLCTRATPLGEPKDGR